MAGFFEDGCGEGGGAGAEVEGFGAGWHGHGCEVFLACLTGLALLITHETHEKGLIDGVTGVTQSDIMGI